ncbi:MAG: electron transfer flavoprotein subunit alpha/FixB family protein [Anaerolineae bacterium]
MQRGSVQDHLLVWVERKGHSIDSASLALLTSAGELAARMSCRLVAVVLGQPSEDRFIPILEQRGVDEILLVENPALADHNAELFSKILADLVRAESPKMLLMPHTVAGIELSGSVAGKLSFPLLTNCINIEPSTGSLAVTRPMFGGTRHVRLVVGHSTPIVATLRGNNTQNQPLPSEGARIRRYDPSSAGELLSRIRLLSTVQPPRGGVDITKADIVVSIGRGIGSKANILLYQQLADALGGVVACSRPLVDKGWLPPEHLVGISGSTVKPKVYLACGISGAVQHIVAMHESQGIIAINTDPAAPIFEIAQVGAVADLNQVIPVLLELAKLGPPDPDDIALPEATSIH